MKTILTSAIAVILLAACGAPETSTAGSSRSDHAPSSPSATTRAVGGCPLTVPQEPAFVPPEPYPHRPPELYRAEWYGTEDLWTMLGPEGEIWEGLPDHHGRFSEKTFWWSARHPDENPSPITVTGRRLDRPGAFETGGSGGGGYREDIGAFMLVGIEIPAGCWELTATYRDVALSYVVLVRDTSV
jgi:hypothetical protein